MTFQKNNIKRCEPIFLIAALMCFSLFCQASVSEAYITKKTNDELLSELKSEDMDVRQSAFVSINKYAKSMKLSATVIEQILRLAAEEQETQASLSIEGGEGEYVTALMEALGNTKDPRAIPYLIKELRGWEVGGSIPASSLNKIGDASVHPLLNVLLHDEVPENRDEAARALALFFKPNEDGYLAQGRTKEMIKHALIEALRSPQNAEPKRRHEHHHKHDKDRDRDHDCKENEQTEEEAFAAEAHARAQVRINIVKALAPLAEAGDKEVIHVLQKVSEEDEYTVDYSAQKSHRGASATYEVREEAKKVMDKTKNNKHNKDKRD